MVLRIQWEFLPSQRAFFDSDARECLSSGAVRSGKSVAGCRKEVKRAMRPGAREFITRKHAVTLRVTTLKTLLEGDGQMPPVLPFGTYTHNQQRGEIKIVGGGEIVYFGLDEVSKIGSRTLSGGFVDEAAEITHSDWQMLYNRASLQVEGLPRQINYACNPDAPEHWLASRFGIVDASTRADGCELFQTRTSDNFFLPPSYVDELRRAYGEDSLYYQRMVLGLWVGREGLCFHNWSRAKNMVARPMAHMVRTIIAIDDGINDPFVALRMHADGLGAIHVSAARYGHNLTIDDKLAMIAALIEGSPAFEGVVVDPSAAQLKTDIAMRGNWSVYDADNAVLPGIDRVIARLAVQSGIGAPGLTIDPTCSLASECMATTPPPGKPRRSLVGEIESYAWTEKPGIKKEIPEHPFSHGPDALRYGTGHLAVDWLSAI